MERDPDTTIADVDLEPGDDVDEGDPGDDVGEIPDTPDEAEGEAWVEEKDVTPDMSADDVVEEEVS